MERDGGRDREHAESAISCSITMLLQAVEQPELNNGTHQPMDGYEI